MSYLEQAKAVLGQVGAKLFHLPELNETRAVIEQDNNEKKSLGENPSLTIGRAFIDNLRIIKDLATLSEKDLELLALSDQECAKNNIKPPSAAKGGAIHLREILGKDNLKVLLSGVSEMANVDSPIFKEALEDLDRRMTKGHELAVSGKPTVDGDPEADIAIWGHTKGLKPEAMAHFVTAHLLARTFSARFKNDQDPQVQEIAKDKDIVLASMIDVVMLRNAQGKAPKKIVEIWGKTREEGGLGWNKPERQAIFNEIVAKQ